jgi:hypothetical protein
MPSFKDSIYQVDVYDRTEGTHDRPWLYNCVP